MSAGSALVRGARSTSAVLAVIAIWSATCAQALTTEEILNYKGPDRQKVLEDGARREGTCRRLFRHDREPAAAAAHRSVREEISLHQDHVLARRQQTGRRQGDDRRCRRMRSRPTSSRAAACRRPLRSGAKIVLPFTSPLFDELRAEDIAADRTWAATRLRYIGLGYNTNFIAQGCGAAAAMTICSIRDGRARWPGTPARTRAARSSPSRTLLANLGRADDAGLPRQAGAAGHHAARRSATARSSIRSSWASTGSGSASRRIIRSSAPAGRALGHRAARSDSEPDRLHPGAQGHEASPCRDAVRRFHPVDARRNA